jgi:membrane protein
MNKIKYYWGLLMEIINKWSDDKAPKLGAALSYYTVFSLAPLLVIAIGVAGIFFGSDAVQGRIVGEIQSLVGKDGAVLIQDAIKKSSYAQSGIIATIISLVTLLITGSAAFIELQDSLNIIWQVTAKPGRAIKEFIRTRLLSFAMIVAIGFLLMVSLVVTTAIKIVTDYFGNIMSFPPFILQVVNIVISLFVISILFGLIYKVLPDVKLSWKDVRVGAIVTAVLFVIGKDLIGLYLGSSSVSTTFGAAGALALLLVWIYYSSQILFLGAEFTYVYAAKFGSGVKPDDHAVKYEINKIEKNDNNQKK